MIDIVDIHKSFRGQRVLRGLDLSIPEGQTTVIIGRSGCGKSVLLKHIMRLIEPDKGQILFDKQDIFSYAKRELKAYRLGIGMVFQGAALFDSITVAENVGFSLHEHSGLSNEEIEQRVDAKLKLVGLTAVSDLMPSSLSGGMKKRVAIARALCNEPRLMLYDEPTTGLDPITADAINHLIVSLRERLNVTSVVVTHDMNSAYTIADHIAMLYRGKIIAQGTPDEIRSSSDPYLQQFIQGTASGPITEQDHYFDGPLNRDKGKEEDEEK